MSKKRKPMLSNKDIKNAGYDALGVRDAYEDLITTGRLSVVVEVQTTGAWYDGFICSRCKKEFFEMYNYCTGCGGKIKR